MNIPVPHPNSNTPGGASSEPNRQKHHGRWLRIAAWISIGLAAVVVLIAATVSVLLHSARFHSYVLSTLERQASARLGARVQLQNFTLHLHTLSVDLYGLTIGGAAPYPAPPLLQVQHLEVGVRVVSVLHGKWYFDSLRVDQPVLKVFTDGHGTSNIPTLTSSGGGSNTSLFDLAIRHAVLDRGEFYYNDKQSSLEADLHNVEFDSSFDSLLKKYSGRLSYEDGHLVAGSLRPIPHKLDAQFEATPTTFRLTKATLTSGPSQLVLTAALDDYSNPTIQAHYEAVLDGGEVRQILDNPSVPVGVIRTSGSLRYREIANQPFINALALEGALSSARLDVRFGEMGARISNLAANYTMTQGDAKVQDLHADLLGGELKATAEMTDVGGNSSHSTLAASVRGVSLEDLRRMAPTSAMPRNITLGGVLNAQANAKWGKNFDDVVARADASVNGRVNGRVPAGHAASGGGTVLPVSSIIHATYTAAASQLELTRSYFRMPQTTLTMNGMVSNRSDLKLAFQSKDLSELETVADMFLSAGPGQSAPSLGLAGKASFDGAVRGSTSAPHLTGQLMASDLRINGTAWRELKTDVDVSPSFASLQHGDLEPASHGSITFAASTGLKKWSFTNTSLIQVTLNASRLDLSDLAKIAKTQIPLTGYLTANIKVHGSELRPVGAGEISLGNSKVYGEPVQSAQLTFSGTGDEVQGNLAVHLPAGSLQSKVSIRPQDKSYVAQLAADQIHLNQLQTLKSKNIDANGVVNLQASGRGTFQNPQLTATLQVPQLEIQKQMIRAINLQMNVANHIATANLTSEAVNSSIRANAKVNLSGQYLADAKLDTQAIPLQPLLAVYAPSQSGDLSGETELHATLRGPLKNWKLLEAHVAIPTLKLAYSNNIQLAAVSPIQVDYKNGLLALQRSEIRGTDTDLQFQGSIPIVGKAPMSVLLLGTVNLQLAQLFDSDIRSSGDLKFNINSQGAKAGSNVNGQIEIVDASFANSDLPLSLQHGNGVLTLTQDRLNITKFQGTVGGGTITAQGGVAYRPGIKFDLGLAAKDIRMLYPQGLRESVNADLRLGGSMDDALLGGAVDITDLSFTPAFDLTNFTNQFSGGVAAPPSLGFSQNLRLNVAVRASNNVSLVSRTLSIAGTANLQVRGTAAEPVILGRVNLSDGDIIFNGDRFVLNGGTIQFVNPSETQPVVNLTLNTTVQQYNISMRFNGPIDQLRTNYSSDPSLPAADIINLLAFGQTTEANSANAATPTNEEAESLVASQVSSQVTSRFSKVAGISQLSINPVLAGGTTQGPPGADITIQQRVTGNLFVTFSTNVATTQDQTIMGQYQLSPRVAVSATRDQSGGVAVDTLIKKTW